MNAVFIAATGQHVGKTTMCLGIISGLVRRLGVEQVGFTKPVGQRHEEVEAGQAVDKDAILFREYFKLSCDYGAMSPVILPQGFTRRFLDEEVTTLEMEKRITTAFQTMHERYRYTLVEGTGHVGVGSIVDLNNAKVASLLNLDMVIIASGGLGSAIDELALNMAMAKAHNVRVRGVILNRVQENKREMILDYFPRALKSWGIPLIGCVPFNHFLSTPCVKDFEILFRSPLISGEAHRYRHFTSTRLVATTLEAFQELHQPKQLIITPAKREDIIQQTLDTHRWALQERGVDFEGGMILTGRHPPSDAILKQIHEVDIPILYAPLSSYDAMKQITSLIAKTRGQDVQKVEAARQLVERYVDFQALCGAIT